MKKFIRWAAVLGLCLSLTVCGALAAEGEISVQLDGQTLAFTDAVPQVKDQRTFLPFKAVFEAMDVDVSYEGNVITAVRGNRTLTMTIGSVEATVTENGATLPITMDVAPYVDAETWRTYVPVRFAAQAFDCAVGWDQAAQTAVIVDTEKLAVEAMAGKSYTYLEKLTAMGDKYKEGIWDMDAAFTADMTMLTLPMMSMEGAVEGTMQDNAKLNMAMNMTLDMDGLIGMSTTLSGQSLSAEDQALLDTLKAEGIDLSMRGDLNTGKLYMNMNLKELVSGLDSDAWYELDMAALMAQAGMDWSNLMTMSENSDLLDTMVSALSTAQPNSAATGYSELKQSFETLFSAFADDKFVQTDDALLLTYDLPSDSGTAVLTLELTMNGDQIVGYGMKMQMTANGEDTAGQSMEMNLFTYMTAEGTMDAELYMDVGGMFALSMDMAGSYTEGTTAPVVIPPSDANIISFTDLMGQSGDLGIIGGADGPTSIVVR